MEQNEAGMEDQAMEIEDMRARIQECFLRIHEQQTVLLDKEGAAAEVHELIKELKLEIRV